MLRRGEDMLHYVRDKECDFDVVADMACKGGGETCMLQKTKGFTHVSAGELGAALLNGLVLRGNKQFGKDGKELKYIKHMLDEIVCRWVCFHRCPPTI